ncbi:MAG: carboxypeptidase regulatory-like domain-containing protein [Terriglobia bacterium]
MPFTTQGALPDTQTLRGEVVDPNSTPIAGAVCTLWGRTLPEAGRPVTTGEHGTFEFTGLIPGTYRLTCAALGYEPISKAEIQISESGEASTLQIELPYEIVVRQKVDVTAQAPQATAQAAAPPTILSNQEIHSLPMVEQKFKAALPMIPGVIRTPDGRIAIKGALENQGTLLVDSSETVDPVTGSFSIDVPLEAVESVDVFKSAYQVEYGRFAGGLTTVQTKAPLSRWEYELNDFVPTPRFETGHLMGIQSDTPRIYFTGPLLGDKFTFSEGFTYDYSTQPVRGLAWPNNQKRKEGWTSFTDFYYTFSPQHFTSVDVKFFPVRREYDNIDSLIPLGASADYGQSGYSIGAHDHYLFAGGGILTSIAQFTEFDSYSHGQGAQDLQVTPIGWEGNFFNAWTRRSAQQEVQENYLFPRKHWHGRHDFKVGGDVVHRAYQGTSTYHPVQLLRADSSLAGEIDFGPAGNLTTADTELAGYAGDHWTFNEYISIDYGVRFSGQTLGDPAAFSPRGGFVFSPAKNGKTILRGGAGIFYNRLPLLAGDFTQNATRQITLFDTNGVALGPPIVYQPYYEEFKEGGREIVPSGAGLGSTPYNFTWNTEVDQEIRPHIIARVSFLASNTYNEFTVNPEALSATSGWLLLSNLGMSRYHAFEATLRVRPSDKVDFNISYVNSQARGDLNTMSSVYIPYEQPVIQPNLFGTLPTNVPDRVVTWGRFKLPRKFIVSPLLDWHSGFPFSTYDDLRNYVGPPNSRRFPAFASLDVQTSKDFKVPLIPWVRKKVLRGSFSVFNVTNHGNYRDVYNTVTSPYFGSYAGFEHRFYDLALDILY